MTRDSVSRGTSNVQRRTRPLSGIKKEQTIASRTFHVKRPHSAQAIHRDLHSLPTGVTARYSQRMWLGCCMDILYKTMHYIDYAFNLRNARASHVGQQARAAGGSPAAAAIHLEVSVPASTPRRRPS